MRTTRPATRTPALLLAVLSGAALLEAPGNIAARAFRQLIDRFCHGSVEELVSGIVEARVLSEAELSALEESVKARARTRPGKPDRKGR